MEKHKTACNTDLLIVRWRVQSIYIIDKIRHECSVLGTASGAGGPTLMLVTSTHPSHHDHSSNETGPKITHSKVTSAQGRNNNVQEDTAQPIVSRRR